MIHVISKSLASFFKETNSVLVKGLFGWSIGAYWRIISADNISKGTVKTVWYSKKWMINK